MIFAPGPHQTISREPSHADFSEFSFSGRISEKVNPKPKNLSLASERFQASETVDLLNLAWLDQTN